MCLHGVLQQRQPHLVQAQGTEQRVALEARHPRRVARHYPGLRAAEQLVAAEAHQRGAAGQHLLRQRLPRQAGARIGRRHRPAAQVHHQRHVRLGRRVAQFRQPRRGHEPLHHEVAPVHRQQRRRAGATGGGVVRHGGLVGGPDLAQAAARGGEDVGNAEAAPDLDQLAARDHHLAPLGIVADGRHHQQQRGRAVVDHGRRRRPAQGRQRLFHVTPTAAALPAGEVQLQVRVGAGQRQEGVDRRPQRCAAEIGVQQDSGGVDHRPQARVGQPLGGGAHTGDDRGALGDGRRGPYRVQLAAHQVGAQRMRQSQVGQAVEQPVDRRDRRERVALQLPGSAGSAGVAVSAGG